MEEKQVLLDVKHLRTSFFTDSGEVKSVNDVSFRVNKQEVVAVVGESGSGKSVTQLSILQLIQSPPGKILGGEVWFRGENLLTYDQKKMRTVRGNGISMIFQEPMTSLNPVYTVGNQLTEVLRVHHKGMSKQEAWARGVKALEAVGIPDPEARMKNYPFEMSGGMRQRVLIAIAVACSSELIIADEPTTALDVTTQAQVMELLMSLVKENGTSIIVVTHNLGLVTRYADQIYVMYAGRIVESGTAETIMKRPRHPYTLGLMESVPKLDSDKGEQLVPSQGTPPNLAKMPEYCSFYPRCKFACEECLKKPHPGLREVEDGHFIACHLDVRGGEGNA